MGMFDTLLIDIDLLPVSDTDKKRLRNETFQTKSLDKSLRTYRINSEKVLEIDNDSGFIKTQSEGSKVWVPLEITTAVRFYTSAEDNNEWFEFVALIDEGKLLVIRRTKNE
jgi:hypothetical protein